QPEDREGAWSHDPTVGTGARGSDHRVIAHAREAEDRPCIFHQTGDITLAQHAVPQATSRVDDMVRRTLTLTIPELARARHFGLDDQDTRGRPTGRGLAGSRLHAAAKISAGESARSGTPPRAARRQAARGAHGTTHTARASQPRRVFPRVAEDGFGEGRPPV